MTKKYKIGIDEAGRGPWLGPVIACALCFNPNFLPEKSFINELNDSKKLTKQKREKIFEELINLSILENPKIFFGVGVVDNFLIDKINIKQANKEAMRRALIEILRKIDDKSDTEFQSKIEVLIDGNDNYNFDELDNKPIFIIEGDSKVSEISAASIIAKVFRDELIKTYSSLYPNFSLDKHQGYGTKIHREYLSDKSKITGIHRLSYKPVKEVLEKKEKLLLHICCGPDATIPVKELKEKYDLTCFWYDPNIQPKKEYEKRFRAFKKVCDIEKVKYIKGPYEEKEFLKNVRGFEKEPERGKRCTICLDMRLKKTQEKAQELEFKYWTTVLTMSPHKDKNIIFEIGKKLSNNKNTQFLNIDFKKNNGFIKSIEYTKKHKIYRQNYCGCMFSKNKDNDNDNE